MTLLLTLPAGASDAPAVLLDGAPLSFGAPPAVDRQRVPVPFRALFEALGYDVGWDGPTHSVTAAGGGATPSTV
ncbi:stalk domain-containing protein [Pseudoflavonifractor phocaeensis]|uniref:stalk domain-containing protein n=1 Tax=Pseudoflavonifractor phocaeensis TaxID=1870988 RepID=UPI00210EC73D|nr:stalk domain-containing protein [Pseudoflavonifractor phocaeensis]MCQ4864126.1 copper amine oxidase N-terminal domain-containing protein [Pseudoflavonifractor phocaeensis]